MGDAEDEQTIAEVYRRREMHQPELLLEARGKISAFGTMCASLTETFQISEEAVVEFFKWVNVREDYLKYIISVECFTRGDAATFDKYIYNSCKEALDRASACCKDSRADKPKGIADVIDFASKLQELRLRVREHRSVISLEIQEPLNRYLSTFPTDTFADKRAICAIIEESLKPLGLAVQMPKPPFLPGKLAAIAGGYPDRGVFQFQVMVNGKQMKLGTFNALPQVKVTDSCFDSSISNPPDSLGEDTKWQETVSDQAAKPGLNFP